MIFLAGPHGAGKTRSAEIMAAFSFLPIDLGPTLRQIHRQHGAGVNFKDWIARGEVEFGQSFTDDLLINEVKRLREILEGGDPYIDMVIVGSRSARGIEKIKNAVPCMKGRGNHVIFLDAPVNVLWRRYNERENTGLNLSDFHDLLRVDLEMGLDSVRKTADFILWNNDDSRHLERSLKEILFQKLGYG